MEPSLHAHVMLVSFPGQGHINPLLRLGKLIASKGLLVTFVTTEQPWGKKMRQANKIQDGVLKPVGLGFLRFEFFDDGLTDDDEKRTDFHAFRPHLEVVGKREIKNLTKRYDEEKEPVTCLINNAYVPWVCDVADELQIPSAVLWVQSCACLTAYYYYHHGLVHFPTKKEPEINVEIPCLPLLKHDQIPSFLHPSSPYVAYGEVILDQFKRLENHKPLSIFIDTFQELEKDIIDYMSNICPQVNFSPVGPLFKMAQTISSDVKGDIAEPASHCMEWLDSREPSSVVYISFGTIAHLKQEQIEEIAHGVLSSGLSVLWVVRPPMEGSLVKPHVLPRELEERGKIVEWCPQERVLAHPAIVCFLSHCGWNSTMEALSSGVPVVCFPQWGDQVTDAVYLVDVFILDQFKRLENHKPLSIFIDTFQELEKDIIDYMSNICPQVNFSPVGPLFKMAQTISSDVKGDIAEPASHCMEWLDSREPSSVVYISFGTIAHLKQEQIEEIAHGVLSSGLSVLWVVRPPMEGSLVKPHVLPRELEERGKIVEWCPQERVLAHPAIVCFLSHCGWNSTMEALSSGVPVVCFPQWGDQVTDAVYLVDVFKTGVRLGRGAAEEKIVPREVVAEKLLEATVGEKAVELRENARRWKEKAEAAVVYGGSSDRNFQEFVDKLVTKPVVRKVSKVLM